MICRRTFLASGLASGLASILAGSRPARAVEARFPDVAWGVSQRVLLDMRPVLAGHLPELPPPPATDSRESRDELRRIAQIQARGVQDIRIERARAEMHEPAGDILRSRGVIPDARVAPRTWGIMEAMDRDIAIAVAVEARRHGRLPPHLVSPEISDLAGTPAMPAFPSMAFARFATALGFLRAIDDSCRRDYEAVLADIGESLIQAGAHRPSDLSAASLLSEIYLAKAMQAAPVEQAIQEARIEMGIHLRLEGCRLPREG